MGICQRIGASVITITVVACSGDQVMPLEQGDIISLQTTAWCEAHPIECGGGSTDPNPSAPGYYIGLGFSKTECQTSNGANDIDFDGVRDFCEDAIAARFAPKMMYGDNVDGEPKWAAQWFGFRDRWLRVFYALSYYDDFGPVPSCILPISFCNPHRGDAEAVVLDLSYDATTEHWILSNLHLSRHEVWDHYGGASPDITYPNRSKGYPAVWVARKKHANYISDAACDSGGPAGPVYVDLITTILHPDDCQSVGSFRPITNGFNNLGSFYVNVNQCWDSSDPTRTGSECFWNEFDANGERMKFRGWYQPGGLMSGPYYGKLAAAGFILQVPSQF